MPGTVSSVNAIATAFVRLGLGAFLAGAGLGAAEPVEANFRRDVQPLLSQYCYDCHGNGNDKGGVTLDEISLTALQDHSLWLRVLRNVRAGIMPPVSEENPLPPAAVEKIAAWIKRDSFGLDLAQPDPGRVTVRRLNRIEYRNTIRDLLGVEFDTLKEFPADDTGHGFDNIGDVLTISPMLTEKYLDAAQAIIGRGVVTKPRMMAENVVLGRQFQTIKVDTKIPEPPKPATPAANSDVVAGLLNPSPTAAATPAPAAPTPTNPAPAAAPAVAANIPAAAGAAPAVAANAAAPGTPAAAGRGQGRGAGFGGRGRGGPPPVTRPAPTVEDDGLILSYYTPATVAAKTQVARAGKYQIYANFFAQETYADNLFDLNKCQVIISIDGQKLLDQEFVREGYSKKFEFTFDRELPAGEHELSMEIVPVVSDAPQYRRLRFKLMQMTLRGPYAEEHWVKTPGYDRYFPRDVPADAAARRTYASEILGRFASRAFRRPIDAPALEKFVALAERIYSQPRTSFETGVAQAMVSVLASPGFLFREERIEPLQRGQKYPQLDEYALASRLSYFLWSSMPDEELLKLAGEKKLRANLAAQMRRLLADKKAEEFVRNFTGQWLQARDILTVPITAEAVFLRDHPTPGLEEARETFQRIQAIPFANRSAEDNAALQKARTTVFEFQRAPKPDLTDALRKAMQQETEQTFAHVIREDRSLLELLDSNYTFLNETLAKHYGIEGVTGNEMRKVTLPPDSPRGGVLTQGTVLAVTSNPTRTSPVKRGVFILEAILGQPPAPPPPNIPALEDAAPADKLKTLNLRDTLALHATNGLCASCHSRMDPLGLALENFNAMGGWRTQDVGQPVLPAGKLVTGETFNDVRELKKVLATQRHRDYYHSIAEKLLTYALGRSVEYYDTVLLDRAVEELEASGGKPSALFATIVNSSAFQQRRESAARTADISPANSDRLVQALTKP